MSPDQLELAHHLRAAIGWLELDLPREALAELDRLPAGAQENPDVLEVRWLVLAHVKDWDAALPVTERLVELAPDRASSWLHHAYALRRASGGSLIAAFQTLAPMAAKFPNEPTIAYNLACYTCQLQRGGAETMTWFERALTIGNPLELIEMALNDSDLAPVRDLIEPLRKKFRNR